MSRSKHGASRGPNPLILVILALVIVAVVLVVVVMFVHSAPQEGPVASVSLPMSEAPAPEREVQAEETVSDISELPAEGEVPVEAESTDMELALQEDPEGDVWVETPYCDLIYPFEMSDTLRVESVPADDGLTVIFYGGINNLEEALYAVHFGVEKGFAVGTLTMADGAEIGVWAEIFEIVPDASWEEAEIDTLYAMQEGVNYTLEQLQNEAGFTAE